MRLLQMWRSQDLALCQLVNQRFPSHPDNWGLMGEKGREVMRWRGRLCLIINLYTEVAMKARSYIFTFTSVSFQTASFLFFPSPSSHWGKALKLPLTLTNTPTQVHKHTHNTECITLSGGSVDITLKCWYYHVKTIGKQSHIVIWQIQYFNCWICVNCSM